MVSSKSKYRLNVDITITEEQHEQLLKYLIERLLFGNQLREVMIPRWEFIDQQVAGYLVREYEDRKRQEENRKGHSPKPVDNNWQFILAQLDEAMTFLLSVLAPDEGIYNAIAPVKKQALAKSISVLMNKHADRFSHYPEYALGIFNALKFNFSPWIVEWENILGSQIRNNQGSDIPEIIENEIIFSGNSHTAANPYNYIYDISVAPHKLPDEGEFFATVDMITEFRAKQKYFKEELFEIDRFINNVNSGCEFFKPPPTIRSDLGQGSQTSWVGILQMRTGHHAQKGFEEITMYCWIPAARFGLEKPKSSSKEDLSKMHIWKFRIINSKYICYAEKVTNAHGMLPSVITTPCYDGLFPDTKSHAEILIPAQQFSSFQLNMHQRAQRKSLIGMTYYNSAIFGDLSGSDAAGGKVPFKKIDPDFDIRRHIAQFNDGPQTDRTLQDVEAVNNLMQLFMPTNINNQVASLERATQYQSAAVVQGANKRNLKIGKLIDAQALSKSRTMQIYNIKQFQESVTLLDENGNEVEIAPAQIRETDVEFNIDAGLRGLDRLALIMHMKEMFNSILQSQQAIQQVDVLKLMDYLTSLMGDHSDFRQFKIESQMDTLSPQLKDAAFQLLQQAMAQAQQAKQAGNGAGTPTAGQMLPTAG